MTTLFSDNFPSVLDGTNWAQQSGTWAWQTGGWVRNTVNNTPPALLLTTTSAHAAVADCTVSVTQLNTGADSGPMARASTPITNNNSCYYVDSDLNGSTLSVFRRNAGVSTLLGVSDGITPAPPAIVKIDVSGTGATVSINKFYNGSQISTTISDTNGSRIVTAGQTGIVNWSLNFSTSCNFDNFLVEVTTSDTLMGQACL